MKNLKKKSNYIFFKKFRTIFFFQWIFDFEEKKTGISKISQKLVHNFSRLFCPPLEESKTHFLWKIKKKIFFYFFQKHSNNFIFSVFFSTFEKKNGILKISQKLIHNFSWLFRFPLEKILRHFLWKIRKI